MQVLFFIFHVLHITYLKSRPSYDVSSQSVGNVKRM